MKRVTSPRLQAFTLIELLVVILIILVLASLLFPVFGLIREKGLRAKCLSNLHHLSLAWNSYVSDNKGALPNPVVGAGGWVGADSPTNIENGVLYAYVNGTNVYRCPGQPASAYRVSYSINTNAIGDLTAIANPPRLLLFIEELDSSYTYGPGGAFSMNNTASTWIDSPAVWHRTGSSLSFADGHVEYWTWKNSTYLKSKMGQHNFAVSNTNDWSLVNTAYNGN